MSASIVFSTKVIFQNGTAITIPVLTTDPVTAVIGDMFFNSSTNQVRVYNGSTWQNAGGDAAGENVNTFVLSSTDISNKFVTLSSAPTTAANTLLNVIGGPMQAYGTDFTVTGSTLSWNGLGLDGILSSTDILIVQFS